MITDFSVSAYGFRRVVATPSALLQQPRRRDDFHVRPHCLDALEYVAEMAPVVVERAENIAVDMILLSGSPSYTRVEAPSDEVEPPPCQFLADILTGLRWLFSYKTVKFSGCSYNFYGVTITKNWPPVAALSPDYIVINARGVWFANKCAGVVFVTRFEYLGIVPLAQTNRRRFAATTFTVGRAEIGHSRALVVPTLAGYARECYERATVSKRKYDALAREYNFVTAKYRKAAADLERLTTTYYINGSSGYTIDLVPRATHSWWHNGVNHSPSMF